MNEIYSFRPTEIALYFYLLKVNNLCSWRESFDHNNQKVLSSIGVSDIRSLNAAKNKLKQAGLINFKSKAGSSSTQYTLTYAKNAQLYVEDDAQLYVEDMSSFMSSKDKLNKTKPSFKKEAKYTKVDFKKKLISLGVLEQYADDWIRVRTDKKASFTESAINGIVKECEINNFPFQEAIKICAENSWQGFKYNWIKNKERNGTHNNTKQSTFNGSGNSTGRNEPYQGGKTSFNQILARKLKATSDSESGNITIDAEVVERR